MDSLKKFDVIKCILVNSVIALGALLQFNISSAFGQEEAVAPEVAPVEIKLSFSQTDSTRTCTAIVTAGEVPLQETEVLFFVKRSFGNLPIESGETDEEGMVSVEFPLDLPGDKNGMLIAIARIEDHDIYGTVEVQDKVNWGLLPEALQNEWTHRSLSASRDKAPMYLIIASNLIIGLIWATIFYVIIQVFRIKQAGKPSGK